MRLLKTSSRIYRYAILLTIVWITASVAALAFNTNKPINVDSFNIKDAERMAEHARKNSNFPITMNELVFEQLNRYLTTEEGREHIKQALARLEPYRPMIERKFAAHNIPTELMAIPIVESGYQNFLPSANPYQAAGVWQFIASTARAFGLKVNKKIDERLDIEKQTEAAVRYLNYNKVIFDCWELAIMAYNSGERRIFKGIKKTGSKSAWELVRGGHENDQDYLAKVMAAILIMKNPNSLN